MAEITKIATVETTEAIWSYDPSLPENRVLKGSLDFISTVRTLFVKICASGTRIAKFENCQRECGISTPTKLSTHSNVRWGSALQMIQKAIKTFDISFHCTEF